MSSAVSRTNVIEFGDSVDEPESAVLQRGVGATELDEVAHLVQEFTGPGRHRPTGTEPGRSRSSRLPRPTSEPAKSVGTPGIVNNATRPTT